MPILSIVSGPTRRCASTAGDRVRTFLSPQGHHARVAWRDRAAIRIGSFILSPPIPPGRVHTVCLYFLTGASINRGGPFEVHARMAGSECCSIQGGPFIPRPGLGSILFCFVYPYLRSFLRQPQYISEAWLQLWAEGRHWAYVCRCVAAVVPAFRERETHSQFICSYFFVRVGSYFSVGRLLACLFLRRSRGTPEALYTLSDLSSSRARARARVVLAAGFDRNRNNGKRTPGRSAQGLLNKRHSAWT